MEKEFKDNASGFEMNGAKPKLWEGAYHGNMHVPNPNNAEAMQVNHEKIMRAVNEGK